MPVALVQLEPAFPESTVQARQPRSGASSPRSDVSRPADGLVGALTPEGASRTGMPPSPPLLRPREGGREG